MMKFKYRYIICEFDMYKITVFQRVWITRTYYKEIKNTARIHQIKKYRNERAGIKVILGNKYQGFCLLRKFSKKCMMQNEEQQNNIQRYIDNYWLGYRRYISI